MVNIIDLMAISDNESDEQKHPIEALSNFEKLENRNFCWDSEEDEETQFAIEYSLKYDKKQKRVSEPYSEITPIPFIRRRSKYEVGSTSSLATCRICHDVLPRPHTVAPTCRHTFCNLCIKQYIGEKLKENIHEVACPVLGCTTLLGLDFIRLYIPMEVFDRWWLAKTEGSVLADTVRFYCRLEGCKGVIVDDERGFVIRACTSCWGVFCMKCFQPCHIGMTCRQNKERLEEEREDREREEVVKLLRVVEECIRVELKKRYEEEVAAEEKVAAEKEEVRLVLKRPVHVVGLNGRVTVLYI